jgi:hypothetical protein
MKPETNGHGNGSAVRLAKLLADREADVAAIRRTLALMNGHGGAAPRNGASVLADALALDAARRRKRKAPSKTPPSKAAGYGVKRVRKARRQRTADLLAHIAKHNAAPAGRFGLGTLIRHGLIRKTKTGYTRTEKPFEV